MSKIITASSPASIQVFEQNLDQYFDRWQQFLAEQGIYALSRHPQWLSILQKSMGHQPICLEAARNGTICGLLPLAMVQSWLFGKFLVSLPYLNTGGLVATDNSVATQLISSAVEIAEKSDVKYLELRHEQCFKHDSFTDTMSRKVHMRRTLPNCPDELWDGLKGTVRNQVRKARKCELTVQWNGEELLTDFYSVFSHNMRDLGTPVYSRKLFQETLSHFQGDAEIGVVYLEEKPIAVGMILHGKGITEIPSASSLREHNKTCANMLLYWTALERAVQRGQSIFDFGRSSPDGPTFKFKKQWGALPEEAHWQYYRRHGDVKDARPDNPKYQKLIKIWQKLPVPIANVLGPFVVRGIP